MKLRLLLFAFFITLYAQSQTSYLWTGTTSTAWNTASNWVPNGIPGSTDNITIVTGANNCVLHTNLGITNITVTSGTLDLGGFTLSPSGNAIFTAGTVTNGTLTVSSGTGNTATLTNPTFNASATLNITTGAININGGNYSGAVNLNQTGSANNTGTGNATFNGTTTITNSGAGYFRMNGNCTFNGTTTFNNTGSGYFLPELTIGNTYNGNLNLNNSSSTQHIRMAYSGNTSFNGNIVVTNTGGAANIGILFCELGSATATLANSRTIIVGGGGFASGPLTLQRFTQTGGTAQNISLTGTATLNISNNSTFNGNLTVSSPNFYLSNSTFNGTTTLTKTDGTTSNANAGGNTFNGTFTVNYTSSSGTGYLSFGNGTKDIFNGDVYSNNNSLDRIIFCHNSANNEFNGDIYLTQTGSSTGTALAWNSTSTSTLASGKTILIGGAGFSTGYLYLQGITQLGSAPVNLTTTGTSSINVGEGNAYGATIFGGAVTLTSADLYIRGGTFNSSAVFTKTGGTNNHNNGRQNIFNSTLTINQQATSGGYFMLSYNSADQFNDDITINNLSTQGVSFGWTGGTGTPVLASGKTILIGGSGFTGGYLRLGGFMQLGTAAINLNLTGTSAFYIENNPSASTINGNLTVTAPDLYIRGGVFNGATVFTKTGGTDNHNNGAQNIFNSTLEINQQSTTGYFMLGYNSNDLFNDNITVTNTGTQGLAFGYNGGTGTPTLAAGKTVSIGGAGFSGGYLRFSSFTQLGNAAINLNMTGSSTLYIMNTPNASVFGGAFTASASNIYVQGGTFNGATSFTKTGGVDNSNNGNQNIFNSTLEINQQSTSGYFMLGQNSNDLFNDDITVTNTGTQGINLGNSTGTGTPTLASGKTILVGGAGFSGGFLRLGGFTQLGSAPINLNFTGTTTAFRASNNSVIGGNVTVTAPEIYFNGATFNGTVIATKTGDNGQWSNGGNIFNGSLTLNNTGAGFLGMANGTADIYNGDLATNNSGSERILFGNGAITLQFNGNITLTENGSATGTMFSYGNTTSCVQAAGKSISIAGGYTSGYLIFERFTQLGTGAINLSLGSGANYLRFGPNSSFGGNIVCDAPRLYFNSSTFNGTVDATKTGGSDDYSAGGNTFASTVHLTHTGTTNGYFGMGGGADDVFNGDLYLTNSGTERILMAMAAGVHNTYNGDIIVSQSATGTGIALVWSNAATATLASGKTILVGGGGFSGGYLYTKYLTQLGSAAVNLPMTGTSALYWGPGTTIGGNVTSTSGSLYFNGCTFNGTVTSSKNDVGTNNSDGGNVFNGVTTITNNGSGQFLLGNINPDAFNANTTFNHFGDYRFIFANNHTGQTTTFAGDLNLNVNKSGGTDNWGFMVCEGTSTSINIAGNLTLNVAGTIQSNCRFLNASSTALTVGGNTTISVSNSDVNTQIQMGVSGISTYNGDIIVSNTGGSTSGVFFNLNSSASSTLANTKTISLGAGGFPTGSLSLIRFTQIGGTAQSLVQTSGTSALVLGPASAFGGNVTFNFPQVYLHGTTYNGTATITKNGSTDNSGNGGNIFNGVTIINNSGDGYLLTGNTNADQFNASTTFNNTGARRIYFAHNHGGQTTTFASDLTLNSAKSSGTDQYSYMIAEGNNVNVIYNGPVTMNISGSINSTFRTLQGTGSTATFNGPLTVDLSNTNTATTIFLGASGISTYNDNISVNNTGGAAGIYFNYNSAASSTLANTKTISLGTGGFTSGILSLVRFTQTGATPQTLSQTSGTAALYLGPTSVFDGNVTFSFPQVYLNSATYNGTANITKNGASNNSGTGGNIFNGVTTINNSGDGYLMTGNNNRDQFNAATTFNNTGSNRIYFAYNHTGQTTTFASTLTINAAKTSGSDQYSYLICEGNNTSVSFGGPVFINNSGSIRSDIRTLAGNNTTATFAGNLTVDLSNTHSNTQIILGNTGTTTYNGNISVANTGAGASGGIYFNNSASASSTLASGNAISLGTGGFTGGTLSLLRFTQLGSIVQTLNQTTGTGRLILGPSVTFNGDVNFNFPQVYLNGGTYNATATIEKNGATDNDCIGGNTFNLTTSITNSSSSGRFRIANTNADTYNGNVTFVQNNAGVLAPNYNTNCTYNGDVTVSSTGAYTITFGSAGSGIATFGGSNAQSISKSGSVADPVFTRLVMNKTSNNVTLNTRINISSTLTMTQGLINTTQSNILNMNNASTTTVGNASSYINGPMNYDMAANNTTRTLNMPVGKGADWRPVALTVRHSAGTSFTYNSEVFNSSAVQLGYSLPATVDTVSSVHYWTIERYLTGTTTVASSTNLSYSAGAYPLIQLYFGTNDYVYDGTNLTIVKNTAAAPTTWIDIGGTSGIGVNASPVAGSVTSTSNPSAFNSFSTFTLGSKLSGLNPLPVSYVSFEAKANGKQVDLNWVTAHEENSNYFAVEHSLNGVEFSTFATKEAVHYSNSNTFYSEVHKNPAKGINYYRITEYDYNNSTTVSSIQSVVFNSNGSVSFYPNPAKDLLQFTSDDDASVEIELMNLNGQTILKKQFSGSATVNLSELNIAEGMYMLRINKGGEIETAKLIIEK